MKRICLTLLAACCLTAVQAMDIWVSPSGNDLSDGSKSSPKATLQGALRQAREARRLHTAILKDPTKRIDDLGNAINIYMEDGVYFLNETLLIRPEDSGSEDCPTNILSAPNARPVLSGGIVLQDWKIVSQPAGGWKKSEDMVLSHLSNSVRAIWTTEVPKVAGRSIDFRQLYINGHKALKACDVEDPDHLNKILAVDKQARTITIPLPAQGKFHQTDGMELFLHQMWEVAVLHISEIEYTKQTAVLHFHEPESRLEFEHPWPPAVISDKGNSPFRLCGAIELMDQCGEWYHDAATRKLYYIPQPDEIISQTEAVVPVLETLVTFSGSIDRRVSHIGFKGITFMHTTWMRPSLQGYVPLQAGMYLLDAYKLPIDGTPAKANLENQAWIGRQPAAVTLKGVSNTFFDACTFQHLGAAGLDYIEASAHDRVEHCVFRDIAGSGIVAGKFSDEGIETHLAYQPEDLREVSSNMLIKNNFVYDCASEYWGCVGIIAGYVRDFRIEHNEVCELPYSGISVGWGWIREANCMKDNLIIANEVHHFGRHNYSCGGLYTLSAQTGTVIAENYVHDIYHPDYVHDTTQGHYIYLDEASSWMTIRDNWCTEAHFGQNQPGLNHWENNGPQAGDSIRSKAGIEGNWKQIRNSLFREW